MKRLVLAIIVIVTFATYALAGRSNTEAQATSTPDIVASASTTSSSAADTTTTSLPSSTSTAPPVSSTTVTTKARATTAKTTVTTKKPVKPVSTGRYKNGTYTGAQYSASYGNVQVRVVISGGKITGVSFLSHPSSNSACISINNGAMPVLISEAIAAQSSNVNTVSGATYTSGAFKKSLASALAKA